MRDGRVDGVLGDIALRTKIVMFGRITLERATLHFHLVRCLPGARDHLADAPHCLRVRRDHRKSAEVMKDILCSNSFTANPGLGEGNILGDARIEMMAHHEHIQMFIYGVDGVGPRRVRRRRQDIGLSARLDDVRCVAAPRTLGVVGVDRAPLHRGQRLLDETGLVERVRVNRHLHVHFIGDTEAAVDGGRCRAPVLVQFESDGARSNLLTQRARQACIALSEEPEIHREFVCRLQHAVDIPGARRTGGCICAGRGPRATAEHGGDTGHQRLFHLLRADEVNMRIDAAGCQNLPLPGDRLGTGTDEDIDAFLRIRITGLADTRNTPVLDADVGLDDTPVIEDQGIGDDHIDDIRRFKLALPHAITNHLAAAEFHLVAINRVILLDLDEEFRVTEPDTITGRWTIHLGIGLPADRCHLIHLRRAAP